MRKLIIIISLIVGTGLLVILGLAYVFFFIGMEPIPPRTHQITNLRQKQEVEIHARDSQKHIHGLVLEVHGKISDSLTFSFAADDSTTYKTVQLTPGMVEFKFRSDWYSTLCFLTFQPAADSIDGELLLEYEFYGGKAP